MYVCGVSMHVRAVCMCVCGVYVYVRGVWACTEERNDRVTVRACAQWPAPGHCPTCTPSSGAWDLSSLHILSSTWCCKGAVSLKMISRFHVIPVRIPAGFSFVVVFVWKLTNWFWNLSEMQRFKKSQSFIEEQSWRTHPTNCQDFTTVTVMDAAQG